MFVLVNSDINISDVEKPPRAKIELGDVTPHNVKQLKTLNTVVFPVSYNEKFYKDVLEVGELAKLGLYLLLTFYLINFMIVSNV